MPSSRGSSQPRFPTLLADSLLSEPAGKDKGLHSFKNEFRVSLSRAFFGGGAGCLLGCPVLSSSFP